MILVTHNSTERKLTFVLPRREGEIPNYASSLETFSIRVTIENIIVLFVL